MYCRYWGEMQGTRGLYILRGIKWVSNKNKGFLLLERCIGRWVQQKDFGRYLSICSEIRSIF